MHYLINPQNKLQITFLSNIIDNKDGALITLKKAFETHLKKDMKMHTWLPTLEWNSAPYLDVHMKSHGLIWQLEWWVDRQYGPIKHMIWLQQSAMHKAQTDSSGFCMYCCIYTLLGAHQEREGDELPSLRHHISASEVKCNDFSEAPELFETWVKFVFNV